VKDLRPRLCWARPNDKSLFPWYQRTVHISRTSIFKFRTRPHQSAMSEVEISHDDFVSWLGSYFTAVGINVSPTMAVNTILVCLFPIIALLGLALSQRESPLPPPEGCRKLGKKGPSNLQDQHSKRYAKGGTRTPGNPWTVKALFVYPLKSCAGVELDDSEVLRDGLKYDRRFTLGQFVTSLPSMDGKVHSEWQFMSLRKFPRLAKVETEMWIPDPSAKGYKEDGEWVKSEGCLVVRFPFSPDTDFTLEGLKNYGKILAARLSSRAEPVVEFRVPFNPPKDRIKSKGYKSQELKIWKDAPQTLDMASEVDSETLAKLKYTLGTSNPVTLPHRPRKASPGHEKRTQSRRCRLPNYYWHARLLPVAHHEPRFRPRHSYQIASPTSSIPPGHPLTQCSPLPRKHLHHRPTRFSRGQLDQGAHHFSEFRVFESRAGRFAYCVSHDAV
jgi:hypothetical protein